MGEMNESLHLGFFTWGGPIVPSVNASMRFSLPDDDAPMSPYLKYLKRHPYQYRQAQIHALCAIGLREEAQRVYWRGKLRREVTA